MVHDLCDDPMSPSDLPPPQLAVAAILRLARELGLRSIGKTVLVKFVYLLDLVVAEQTGGKILTGLDWRFHHFGPYDAAIEPAIGALANKAFHVEHVETTDRDMDRYAPYAAYPAPSLQDLGLDIESRGRLTGWVRAYGSNLPGLLEFVYGDTQPMQGARAGQSLDFSDVMRPNYKTDIRPIPIPVTSASVATRAKALLAAIGASYAAKTESSFSRSPPPYDEVFAQEQPVEESVPVRGQYLTDIQGM